MSFHKLRRETAWLGRHGPKLKQPWHFLRKDEEPFSFAGLWEHWRDPAGPPDAEPLRTFTIITGPPNELVAPIHDRMPVFLSEDQFSPWLSGEAGMEVLKPASHDYLQRWPVSKRVNSSKADADDATLIEQVEPESLAAPSS